MNTTSALTRVRWPRAVVDERQVWWVSRCGLAAATLLMAFSALMGPEGLVIFLVGLLVSAAATRPARVRRLRLVSSIGPHTLVETADARLVAELAAALNQDPSAPGAVVCACGRVAFPGERACPVDGARLPGAWHADA